MVSLLAVSIILELRILYLAVKNSFVHIK